MRKVNDHSSLHKNDRQGKNTNAEVNDPFNQSSTDRSFDIDKLFDQYHEEAERISEIVDKLLERSHHSSSKTP